MTVRSKRWIVAGTVACVAAALPFGAKIFAQNPAPATPKLEMSDKYFKKVQVLTNIPVDEFMGTMGLFSAALSYCCGDCHVGAGTDNPDWASDKNPRKVRARQMAAMVKEINRGNFGGTNQVTCWTCHRGSPNPAVTPSIDTIYGEPLSFPPDTVLAAKPGQGALTLDQIFDKYVQALGGAEATGRLTSYTAKGTSHLFGETREDPVEIYAKAPDSLATFVHQRGGDLARTFDGRDAWVMLPLTVVGKVSAERERARRRQTGRRTGLPLAHQELLPELARGHSDDARRQRSPGRAGQRHRHYCDVLLR